MATSPDAKARAVDDSIEAASESVCGNCGHRVGWNGVHDEQQTKLGRTDWKTCNHCKHVRAALRAVYEAAAVKSERDG